MRKFPFLRPVRVMAVAALALASVIVVPGVAASAAEIGGIDAVVIAAPDPANPDAPLELNQSVVLDITWSVSNGSQPGDTFSLRLPGPLSFGANAQRIELAGAAGESVGTCRAMFFTITDRSLVCTLSDYVLTHDDVHGTVTVQAVARQSTDADALTFTTSTGVEIVVPVPGGGIVDTQTEGPAGLKTYGVVSSDGESIDWTIVIPVREAYVYRGFTDVYDSALGFDPASVQVGHVAAAGWQDWVANADPEWLPAPSDQWSLSEAAVQNGFDLFFNDTAADGWYVVNFVTALPDDVAPGDVFGNEVLVLAITPLDSYVYTQASVGGGGGDRSRTISVTKAVDGTATAPAVDFGVAVTCVDKDGAPIPDYPQTAEIAAGEVAEFDDIIIGSVCTVTEPDDGGADAVAFTPSDSVVVTADSPTVIELTVTNTFNLAPVPAVDIEKWSTVDGYPAGDFDVAPGKLLEADVDEAITFTITNTGEEPLTDVVVDETAQTGAVLTDIGCDFSPLGGPVTGATWAGPFAVGATFDCQAVLPGMSSHSQYSGVAAVDAVGQTSGVAVNDEDAWHGTTQPVPVIDIENRDTMGNDADSAGDAAVLPNGETGLVFTITNNGDEPLSAITVSNRVISNGVVENLSCRFADDSVGVKWSGLFAVGDSFNCTAELSGVVSGLPHEGAARVIGTGQISGAAVDDTDPYFAVTPASSGPILAMTGSTPIPAAGAALIALLLGVGLTIAVARRRMMYTD